MVVQELEGTRAGPGTGGRTGGRTGIVFSVVDIARIELSVKV